MYPSRASSDIFYDAFGEGGTHVEFGWSLYDALYDEVFNGTSGYGTLRDDFAFNGTSGYDTMPNPVDYESFNVTPGYFQTPPEDLIHVRGIIVGDDGDAVDGFLYAGGGGGDQGGPGGGGGGGGGPTAARLDGYLRVGASLYKIEDYAKLKSQEFYLPLPTYRKYIRDINEATATKAKKKNVGAPNRVEDATGLEGEGDADEGEGDVDEGERSSASAAPSLLGRVGRLLKSAWATTRRASTDGVDKGDGSVEGSFGDTGDVGDGRPAKLIDPKPIVAVIEAAFPGVVEARDGVVYGLGDGGNERREIDESHVDAPVSVPIWSGPLDEREILMLLVFVANGLVYGSSANFALDRKDAQQRHRRPRTVDLDKAAASVRVFKDAGLDVRTVQTASHARRKIGGRDFEVGVAHEPAFRHEFSRWLDGDCAGRMGFFGNWKTMMDNLVMSEVADECDRSGAPVRLVPRWFDEDDVVDAVLVHEDDFEAATIVSRVPAIGFDGAALGVQFKTQRCFWSGARVLSLYPSDVEAYAHVPYVRYDYELDRFLFFSTGQELLDRMTPTGHAQQRPDIEDGPWYISTMPASVAIVVDPNHDEGKALWDAEGITKEQLVAKLAALWVDGETTNTCYEDMMTSNEAGNSRAFQQVTDIAIKITDFPCQIIDAFILVDDLEVKMQEKSTNAPRGDRLAFPMRKHYDEQSFDVFLLNVRVEGRVVGFCLLPTSMLWKHRYFPGQEKLRCPYTGEVFQNPRMRTIKLASVPGLELPGLKTVLGQDHQLFEFMMEIKNKGYYVPVKEDGEGYLQLGDEAKQHVAKILRESTRPWDKSYVVGGYEDASISPQMLFESHVDHPRYAYVTGGTSARYVGTSNNHKARSHVSTYDGRDFGLGPGWTIEVVRRDDIVKRDVKNATGAYPPAYYPSAPRFGTFVSITHPPKVTTRFYVTRSRR
ncbi:hypothetical protein JL720_4091 [Aureococcus anophagefferens]|nr:hypothetical protein JL720_4091 [Aureococcus anophagefferens]